MNKQEEFVFNPKYPNEITATRDQIDLSTRPLAILPLPITDGLPDSLPELSAEETEKFSRELRASLSKALTRLSIEAHKRFDRLEADNLR